MSRRDGINIGAIIDECKSYKDTISKAKKSSEPLEKQIKEYAVRNGLEKIQSDNWQAKITVTPKQEFSEELAIVLLQNMLTDDEINRSVFKSIVKTKEYIDEGALENAIYNGDIDAKLLASCTIEKPPTVRLTIGKIKN